MDIISSYDTIILNCNLKIEHALIEYSEINQRHTDKDHVRLYLVLVIDIKCGSICDPE